MCINKHDLNQEPQLPKPQTALRPNSHLMHFDVPEIQVEKKRAYCQSLAVPRGDPRPACKWYACILVMLS